MIIYGSRTTHLASYASKRAVCRNCSNQNTIHFSFYSRHVHIFWIPMFPIGKFGESQCSHCKQALSYAKMPNDWKQEYRSLKRNVKTPFWKYTGLALFLLLIGSIPLSNRKEKTQTDEYYQNPLEGDVYYYSENDSIYSSFKIRAVATDTVYFNWNEYYVFKKNNIGSIDLEKNYNDDFYYFTSSEIDSMYRNGGIIKIIR